MSKKAIGIVAAVLLLIITIVAVFMLKGNKIGNTDNSKTPTQEEIDLAKDLQEYYPDKTQEEIISMGREELTTEQTETFNTIIDIQKIPEVAEIISTPADQDLENEKPTAVYRDLDGNTVIWEIEDEVWNATEENLEADIEAQLEEMRQRTKEHFENQGNNLSQVPTGNGSTVTKTDTGYVDEDNRPVDKNGLGLDIYGGFNTYEEYIEDLQRKLPHLTLEQIKEAWPDQATLHVDEAVYNQDIKDNLLHN